MFHESIERGHQFWSQPSRWAYAIIVPWVLGVVFDVYSSHHFHQVAGRQRVTQGQIVGHEPRNHNRYRYTFSVNGRDYGGWESPRAEPLSLGQRVQVFYDPNDPETSALRDFTVLSWEAFGAVLLTSIGITGVVVVVFVSRRRSRVRETAGRAMGD